MCSPFSLHRDTHAKAKPLGEGRWLVAPLTQEHIDNCVIEYVDRKFKDMRIWFPLNLVVEADFENQNDAFKYMDDRADPLRSSTLDVWPFNSVHDGVWYNSPT